MAVKDTSSTHTKDIFELPLTRFEPLNGESWQAGGRPFGWSSHPSQRHLCSEKTSQLGDMLTNALEHAVCDELQMGEPVRMPPAP